MKIKCPHCGSKARITSRNEVSDQYAVLYCSCNNSQSCGASFTFNLAFGHELTPSRQNVVKMAEAIVQANLDLSS